ncbi:MAG: hypothetical protein M9962_07115 [Oligoflexia bacterium]|nr:hypothetical protein [Oligoflexia bacterium]
MDTQEALKKIEEINTVIRSSNKALFSGRHMVLYGAIVLLIPVIGHLTKWLTFGYDFGSIQKIYTIIANTLFFWGVSVFVSKLLPRSESYKKHNQSLHPLITKAFSITRPIALAIFGVVIIFSLTNRGEFIYPVVLILLGLMFSIYGKFTIDAVTYFAWSYIFCGLLHFYLLSYNIPYLAFYFLAYNGISYIIMGILLSKEENAHA